MVASVHRRLKPYFPGDDTKDPTFGEPSAEWAAVLINIANDELSLMLGWGLKLTNAEMQAELSGVMGALEKAQDRLGRLSLGLDVMLGADVDVIEYRDKIGELLEKFRPIEAMIPRRPRVRRVNEVRFAAAKRMAVYVLRRLHEDGIKVSSTVDEYHGTVSDAVKILKILGDALSVPLSERTWKKAIISVRVAQEAPVLEAPQK